MIYADVIIVGGGPAGSTCAWKLKEKGIDVLLLDKQNFPRTKPCAGWITPRVLKNLKLNKTVYPYSLTRFDKLHIHYKGNSFSLPTRQYAIRRIEFDHWLLERSAVPVHIHTVDAITSEDGYYILDDVFRCKYLVGAGGTSCPVYRTFFKTITPRLPGSQITALEIEYAVKVKEEQCHLWFSDRGLAGYSWFVPKTNGYVNIGIGAKTQSLKSTNRNIHEDWENLTDRLISLQFIGNTPPAPQGYTYYLRNKSQRTSIDKVFIIGDAVGLATKDMGEGIGPAVESGIRAAEAISQQKTYSVRSIGKYSLRTILLPL